MTYLSDRSRARKNYKYYVLVVIIFGLFIYFWPNIRAKLYSYVESIVINYGNLKSNFSKFPSSFHLYFSSREELDTRNKVLELNIERLENILAQKDALLIEHGFVDESGASNISSSFILYPLTQDMTTIYSTILLSKGFKDGIEEGSPVYLRGKQVACIISEVHDHTSLCKLLSASGNSVEGSISLGGTLFLKGYGGGAFIADVPKDSTVAVGEQVRLRSDPTFIIGDVIDTVADDQASSLRVYVRGPYNPVTSNVFYINK